MPYWDGLKMVYDHTDYGFIGKIDGEMGIAARPEDHPVEFHKAYLDGYALGQHFLPYLEPVLSSGFENPGPPYIYDGSRYSDIDASNAIQIDGTQSMVIMYVWAAWPWIGDEIEPGPDYGYHKQVHAASIPDNWTPEETLPFQLTGFPSEVAIPEWWILFRNEIVNGHNIYTYHIDPFYAVFDDNNGIFVLTGDGSHPHLIIP